MWALFLPGVVAVGNVIIVRNFFENNIPRELLEAAEIDGASKWTVFVKMVIPLSRSIMAVMVVYSMVAYWNDWFTALIYLRADQAPLPLVLRNILIKSSTSASQSSMVAGGFAELNKLTEMIKFASIIVAAAPMLIVYPFVQKYFEKGFMQVRSRAKIATAACGGNREQFLAQRSARRETRPRVEADAGHRKRALKPLPGTESDGA